MYIVGVRSSRTKVLLATDYSHMTKPGTTERLRERKVFVFVELG